MHVMSLAPDVRRAPARVIITLAGLALMGCAGSIGAGDSDGDDGVAGAGGQPAPSGEPGTGPIELCKQPSPGLMPLRRLTKLQFRNTVKDLFGTETPGALEFPDTALRDGFRTYADFNTVTADGAGAIATAATAVAKQAAANLNALLGCMPGPGGDDACVAGYVDRLAKSAYRRPPHADEVQTLRRIYSDLRTAGWSPQESVEGVIEVVLQSPQFLYIFDMGKDAQAKPGSVAALTDHEVAARLSYFLWDTKPDESLTALADEGKLGDPEIVEQEVRRLLASDRAQSLWTQFTEDWLHLHRLEAQDKDGARFAGWNAELKAAMRAEAGAFVNDVVYQGDAKLKTLLTAPYTMANGALAKVYGAKSVDDSNLARIDLNPDERAGLLTSAAFLTAHAGFNESFPVLRGAFVRKHMLCQDIAPPSDLVIELPPADPNVRGRERFAQHRDNPACSGCHALMDPIGFGLENYDAIGGFRTTEGNDLQIDASGELADAGDDISGPFVGGIELSEKLAQSTAVRHCLAQQMLSYAIARGALETDDCALRFVADRFSRSEGDLKELLVAVALSDAFMFRRIPEREQ